LYQGPVLAKIPELQHAPVAFRDDLGPGISGQRDGRGISIANELRAMGDTEGTLTHEAQHQLTANRGSQPITAVDYRTKEGGIDYQRYRADPEEFVAHRAEKVRFLTKPGKVAAAFNLPDDVVPYNQMTVGYSPDYSQTDMTMAGQRQRLFDQVEHPYRWESPPLPAPAVSDFGSKVGKFLSAGGKAFGAVGNIAGVAQMVKGYQNAKKSGASPLAGLLSPLGIAPITEQLQTGEIYDHSTGEKKYPNKYQGWL